MRVLSLSLSLIRTSRRSSARDAINSSATESCDGKNATTAIQLGHSGLTELRRVAYHAPFRVDRPEPEYDGIGVVEPLASQLTDVPPDEY